MKSFRQFCVEMIANSAGGGYIAGMGSGPAGTPAGPLGTSTDGIVEAEFDQDADPNEPSGSGGNDGDTNDEGFDHEDDRDTFIVVDAMVQRCNVAVRPYQEWLTALGSSPEARMIHNFALHNRLRTFSLKGKQSGTSVTLKHDGAFVYRV
jgi:hypothetical protein